MGTTCTGITTTMLQRNQEVEKHRPAKHGDRIPDLGIRAWGYEYARLRGDRKRLPQLPTGERSDFFATACTILQSPDARCE
jgi:hypothetical protein